MKNMYVVYGNLLAILSEKEFMRFRSEITQMYLDVFEELPENMFDMRFAMEHMYNMLYDAMATLEDFNAFIFPIIRREFDDEEFYFLTANLR